MGRQQVEWQFEYLTAASWEAYRLFAGTTVIAAALLVVATFNPTLIPVTPWTRLAIASLLYIVGINLWCSFLELNDAIHQSIDKVLHITKEVTTSDVEGLKKVLKYSPVRRIQLLSLVALTLILIFFIALILKPI